VDLAAAARQLAPVTALTIVADYVRRPRYQYDPNLNNFLPRTAAVRAVATGDGFIDYRSFFTALKAGGYDGWIAYEMCAPLEGGGSEENLDRCAAASSNGCRRSGTRTNNDRFRAGRRRRSPAAAVRVRGRPVVLQSRTRFGEAAGRFGAALAPRLGASDAVVVTVADTGGVPRLMRGVARGAIRAGLERVQRDAAREAPGLPPDAWPGLPCCSTGTAPP